MTIHQGQIAVIYRQLHQLFHGGNWLDENFDKKLLDIAEEDAFRRPLPEVHSVAEIAWHCIYWHKVNLERMKGNPEYRNNTIEEQNFLPLHKLREIGWIGLMENLKLSFEEILQMMQDKDDSFLAQEFEHGKTFGFLLLGTVEHDAYHLGQIGLVIKMLKTTS